MTEKLPQGLLNNLHNARTQTQEQIQQQNQQNAQALADSKQFINESIKNVKNDLKNGMASLHSDLTHHSQIMTNLLTTQQTAMNKLNTAILEQNQTALTQASDELTQLQTLIGQTNGQIQQAIKRLESDSLNLIQTTGDNLRQAILDDQSKTLGVNSQSHHHLRQGIEQEHQQTYQIMKDKNLELNKSINIFRLDKMPLTASMGFISGIIFLITLALAAVMWITYQEWRGLSEQVDNKTHYLQQLDEKINKTPNEQKLLTLIQVNPFPQGVIIEFNPQTKVNTTTINGKPQIILWQDSQTQSAKP
ncbi:hypothetical protein SKB0120_24880 (plasmid) [Moraxella osloensis]